MRLRWVSRRGRVCVSRPDCGCCGGDWGSWISPFERVASPEETILIGREGRGVELTVDTLPRGGRVMAVDGFRS